MIHGLCSCQLGSGSWHEFRLTTEHEQNTVNLRGRPGLQVLARQLVKGRMNTGPSRWRCSFASWAPERRTSFSMAPLVGS